MPIAKAMEEHGLIVWAMNGEPLPNIHGGPVRLVIPGWPGSLSHKWLTKITIRDREHDGQGMTGTSYRVAIKPMVPGGKADDSNFRILESMPVRWIITNPSNGDEAARRHAQDRAPRRGLGRRPRRRARRRLDRFRRDLDAGQDRSAAQPLRLGALDREPAAALRRLLRALGPGDRLERPDAAPRRRQLEPAGLWRQPHAPRRGPGRLTGCEDERLDGCGRPPSGLARGAGCACAGAGRAGLPAERRDAEDLPEGPGREETFYACTACHNFKLVAAQGLTGRSGTTASPG